jgi:hypothetical protein
MHPRLTVILAEEHIADLHRAADHYRLVHTATTANSQPSSTAGRHVAAAPGTLIRRLRRHLAPTRPASR